MTPLSRRSALALMAATPTALGLSSLPLHALDLETALHQALDGIPLPMTPVRLELVRFKAAPRAGQTHLSAVVRMTWPPGMRQRTFEATADGSARALSDLVQQIQTTFAKAGQA